MAKSEILAACSLFLFSFCEELVSIFINLLFLPKNIKIKKSNLVPDKYTLKSILNISIPTVSSRIIGNIGYFFEPIILKNLLLFSGYSNNYILVEYGAYNAYALTTLTVPSFFIVAISSSLVPEISKHYLEKRNDLVKKRLKEAIFFSLLIGIGYSILLIFFGKEILNAIYDTNLGLTYIKILEPIFHLFYIESILISFLQAIDKAHITMRITIIGVIVKLITLALTSLLHIGLFSLIVSEIVNILLVVFLNVYYVCFNLKKL